MNDTEIMVRYGELSTKGKNRKTFIQQLAKNVRLALHEFPEIKIKAERDRMHLLLNGADSLRVTEQLKKVFGIQNFSPSIKIEKTPESIMQEAVRVMKEIYRPGMSFKVNAKRADHEFVWDTSAINREVGHAVIEALPDIKVQMKQPDITLRVEVRLDGVFLSYQTIQGIGGLPVGTSGKGMLMLSGGIDSPVAGYLAMKRGVEIEAVHFYSPPYTNQKALQKAQDLAVKLAPYGGSIQFIEVPFTEIQEEIKEKVPSGYLMTVTRRMMLRITDELRERRKALAIINGESLGQVASQTLQSMIAINDVTTAPIIRPLVTMDKTEIIQIAEKIDTYELAIQPYEDCCTIFAPPQPKTRPRLEKAREYESRLAVDALIQRAIENIKITEIKVGQKYLNDDEEIFCDLL